MQFFKLRKSLILNIILIVNRHDHEHNVKQMMNNKICMSIWEHVIMNLSNEYWKHERRL